MGILQVMLFGGVRATFSDWTHEIQLTRENQGLLAYLILQRHRVHSRDVLANIFWGEDKQEKARGSLNTALWKLKKALEPEGVPAGTYLKNTHSGEVGFNRESPHWIDIEILEEKAGVVLSRPIQAITEYQIQDVERVLSLCNGEVLEGFYRDWAIRERERMHDLHIKSLLCLLQYYGLNGAYEKAITYGQRILYLDPFREEIHRELMRLYLLNGQRTLALRQYKICCSFLAQEFGLAPMEDTQALYLQILSDGEKRTHRRAHLEEHMGVEKALEQLREASQTIDSAKKQIEQALQLIRHYSRQSH